MSYVHMFRLISNISHKFHTSLDLVNKFTNLQMTAHQLNLIT